MMRSLHVEHVTEFDLLSADWWDVLVLSGPAAALATAAEVLARWDDAPEICALAHLAASRSHFELGRLGVAREHALAAVERSATSSDGHLRFSLGLSVSVILAEGGLVDDGLQTLSDLEDGVDGVDLGRLCLQAAYLLQHAGRLDDALERCEVGERHISGSDDGTVWARLHLIRGLILLQLGRLDEAQTDIEQARRIADANELTLTSAQAASNLGVLHGRARRPQASMREFELARTTYRRIGDPGRAVVISEIDRAEVMMHLGLIVESVEAARNATRLAVPSGNAVVIGDAQLMLARAERAAGLLDRAVWSAEIARETFQASGRADMVVHARAVGALAGLDDATADGLDDRLTATLELADELRSVGWRDQSDGLLLAAVQAGFRFRSLVPVRSAIAELRADVGSDRRDRALSAWYAEAVARFEAGSATDALAACRAGLDGLDDMVVEANTLEQRFATMRLGAQMSQLAIDIAIEANDADTVLGAAEGTRARALHDSLNDGRRHRSLTVGRAARLRAELAARLGDRVLVMWLVSSDSVWAVVVDQRGPRLVKVGDAGEIRRERDRLLTWLDRAAIEPDGSSAGARRAAERLDRMLLGPLKLDGTASAVMVPIGLLHGIPWSGLPSLTDLAFTLVPNAQLWLESDRRSYAPIETAGIVVGPDLVGEARERLAFERHYPRSMRASGQGATASALRSMFGGTDLVHIAAHGRFRSDRPLLSAIQLHEGEVSLLEAVPAHVGSMLVVLSSCEGGAQGTSDGSEVLGLSSVLLARGATAVLAPLTVVRDLECADFVADVHDRIAAGIPFAQAVAGVRRRWFGDDDLSRWAVAASFACFGSGSVKCAVPD